MGNCAASRLRGGGGEGEEADAVALCRARKRLLKLAVERRAALAAAHADYVHSLGCVAAALRLFVARHSTPSPILLTFAPSSPPPPSEPPQFLRHTPAEPKTEAFIPPTSASSRSSSAQESSDGGEFKETGAGEEEMKVREETACRYFFSAAPPSPPPGGGVFGWDFFNPFDGMRAGEVVGGLGLERSSEEELRVVREEEGIPELEEDEVEEEVGGKKTTKGDDEVSRKVVEVVEREEEKGAVEVMASPERGRELLEALRDVEGQFIRAYDAGKEVSHMLEAHRICLPPPIEEEKENPSKTIQAITWHRSPSSLSSSYKSYLASSSNSTSWAESKGDFFDECSGMDSGSHSQTLSRLYAWEKKLYEEVKAGDETRQVYEHKCIKLRNQDAGGADSHAVDKTRAAVKDLYTRILVALKSAETISIRIQKLRDDELQPQLIELLQGLRRTWKIILESHETQKQIMSEVKSFTCPSYGKFCSDSQRHATVKMEAELQYWRTCFMSYIAAQRAYIEALDGWLSRFIIPEIEYYSPSRSLHPSYRVGAPPLVVICHEWLTSLRKLPDKPVSYAMKSFMREMRVLWAKQGEEQHQKRKVDGLAKELDRKVLAVQKAENKILESKIDEIKPEPDVRQRVEYLASKKELLDTIRKKVETGKVKHHDCMQETVRVTFNGFKIGLANVFESLTEFSKECLEFYGELLKYNEKAKLDEMAGKQSCIEGLQMVDDKRR